MKSTIGWTLAIVFGLLLLLLLPGLWMMGRFWGGYGGMMGGPGMMGGYGYMHPFGWGGMLLGWLVPVGVIVLLVVGTVALVNSLNRSRNPTQPRQYHYEPAPIAASPPRLIGILALIVVKSYLEVRSHVRRTFFPIRLPPSWRLLLKLPIRLLIGS